MSGSGSPMVVAFVWRAQVKLCRGKTAWMDGEIITTTIGGLRGGLQECAKVRRWRRESGDGIEGKARNSKKTEGVQAHRFGQVQITEDMLGFEQDACRNWN